MSREKTRSMVFIALFSALIAVFSQLVIPTPTGIPVTLQTFIVALSGYYLGSVKGMASVLVYIAAGAVGIPVFSGFRGGIAVLLGPTGGFILGFIFMVLLCGIKTKKAFLKPVFGIIGVIACHIMGVLWFTLYSGDVLNAFLTVSLPYLLKDFISVCIAVVISAKIMKMTEKLN